jgi:hypothetical protein
MQIDQNITNSKVLLVDTNYAARLSYEFLVSCGYQVFVVGGNPNDYLAKLSPNYIKLDYSNVENLLGLITELNIDYLVPGCNDLSYSVCAQVNSRRRFYGIDSEQTTDTLNNKAKFRSFAKTLGLSVPRVLSEQEIQLHETVIVKPVDAFSGRGVAIVPGSDKTLLKESIQNAREQSRSGDYVVEEYVTGRLHSHSAFFEKGLIAHDFIVEEFGSANPFVVDTSYISWDFPPLLLERIRQEISSLAKALSIDSGLIHTQFIRFGDEFKIVEITRRCPGDLYSLLIQMSTGFPYGEAYARPFLNLGLTLDRTGLERKHIMRHTISSPVETDLHSVKFHRSILIREFFPLLVAGSQIKPSPYSRVGLLFAESDSSEELESLCQTTIMRNLYSF